MRDSPDSPRTPQRQPQVEMRDASPRASSPGMEGPPQEVFSFNGRQMTILDALKPVVMTARQLRDFRKICSREGRILLCRALCHQRLRQRVDRMERELHQTQGYAVALQQRNPPVPLFGPTVAVDWSRGVHHSEDYPRSSRDSYARSRSDQHGRGSLALSLPLAFSDASSL
ncbi:hypothetical protein P43SY_012091 [Pythium insidiosum]|uniref:Uncharacterized protein n=1 Tax=Pythium insidiosum TaxID=114742 RepID=A0AAD5Q366_PYTIN|nr:hypothetical protein P43SY_012091 [Pythium insidiosum]